MVCTQAVTRGRAWPAGQRPGTSSSSASVSSSADTGLDGELGVLLSSRQRSFWLEIVSAEEQKVLAFKKWDWKLGTVAMPVIPTAWELRQDDCSCEASLTN